MFSSPHSPLGLLKLYKLTLKSQTKIPPTSNMDEKSELISSSASISSTDDLLKSKTDSEEYYDDVMIASHFRNRRARWRRFLLPVIVHFILIAIYTGTTIYLLDRNDKKWDHGPHLINCMCHIVLFLYIMRY